MSQKTPFSKGIRLLRENAKKTSAFFAAKTCKARCFSIFGVPAGLSTGLEDGSGKQSFLYPEVSFAMCPPLTIEPQHDRCYQALLSGIKLPAEGILVLKDGTATYKGGNLCAQGKLVTTFLQPIDGKPPHQNDLFRFSTKKFFPRMYRADAPVISLASGWQGAFYHWVYEVLSRLHLIEKAGYPLDKIYIESNFSFQKQSLELLNISEKQIINAKEYAAVRSSELIIPSIPVIPTQWGCSFLREKILPQLSKSPFPRVYVSRNDASRRRILNEEALLTLLKKYGFEKVLLSGLTFKQQAELFHTAEAVIGPHGAGFSHLVFCQPQTAVLEIFSPAYVNPCYWHVCDRVALRYHYLFGEGAHYLEGFHLDPDIVVDLAKVEASLRLMNL